MGTVKRYDFPHAEHGKFYTPIEDIQAPIPFGMITEWH